MEDRTPWGRGNHLAYKGLGRKAYRLVFNQFLLSLQIGASCRTHPALADSQKDTLEVLKSFNDATKKR
jgi:hypothetical protein